MASSFEKRGYNVENWDYPSRAKIIEMHTKDLLEALNATATASPGEAIHFVTHSLGGIIVRGALNHPDCPVEARQGRAVLMAPPNRGSEFGRFLGKFGILRKMLGDYAGRELCETRDFDYLGNFPEGMKVLVISGSCGWNPIPKGKNDGKLSVEESCLPTYHKHMIHFSGHSWIMQNPTVIYNACCFIDD